ncbi:MAG TPA: hypothetical protein PLH19_07635 [Anaerolineae bacterium]|nr:hypothetical protein [Anaerolineae bacterium]
MNRKPWPILVGIALVLLLAAAALWWRPRPAAPTVTLAPALTPSPTHSPPIYQLHTLSAYDMLAAANVAPAVTICWASDH